MAQRVFTGSSEARETLRLSSATRVSLLAHYRALRRRGLHRSRPGQDVVVPERVGNDAIGIGDDVDADDLAGRRTRRCENKRHGPADGQRHVLDRVDLVTRTARGGHGRPNPEGAEIAIEVRNVWNDAGS